MLIGQKTVIEDKDYVQRRLEPKRSDVDYLHLVDLIDAIKQFRSDEKLVILDYGCGGSPYRSLFPNAEYRRADFAAMRDLDYVIGNDSRLAEEDGTFDLILSTQVAEHVSESHIYFAECYRLLKAGGRLICTTHGTFPDHACPYDFQRWTADGLARDIRRAGFKIERSFKLTTNGRALIYLFQKYGGWFDSSSNLLPPVFRVIRGVIHRLPRLWNWLADKVGPDNRVVESHVEGHDFYIVLMVEASKG